MKYDLFAEFYENSSEEPRYKVWMGSIFTHRINELESMGFGEVIKEDDYLDYVKEATEEDLEEFTQSGYECEMLDVLDAVEYDRILIRAYELDVIDDESNSAPMGLKMGDTYVEFTATNPDEPVWFLLPNVKDHTIKRFKVAISRLKRYFKVLTLLEVKIKLSEMASEKEWTFAELKKLFNDNKETMTCHVTINAPVKKVQKLLSFICATIAGNNTETIELNEYNVDKLIRIIEGKNNITPSAKP